MAEDFNTPRQQQVFQCGLGSLVNTPSELKPLKRSRIDDTFESNDQLNLSSVFSKQGPSPHHLNELFFQDNMQEFSDFFDEIQIDHTPNRSIQKSINQYKFSDLKPSIRRINDETPSSKGYRFLDNKNLQDQIKQSLNFEALDSEKEIAAEEIDKQIAIYEQDLQKKFSQEELKQPISNTNKQGSASTQSQETLQIPKPSRDKSTKSFSSQTVTPNTESSDQPLKQVTNLVQGANKSKRAKRKHKSQEISDQDKSLFISSQQLVDQEKSNTQSNLSDVKNQVISLSQASQEYASPHAEYLRQLQQNQELKLLHQHQLPNKLQVQGKFKQVKEHFEQPKLWNAQSLYNQASPYNTVQNINQQQYCTPGPVKKIPLSSILSTPSEVSPQSTVFSSHQPKIQHNVKYQNAYSPYLSQGAQQTSQANYEQQRLYQTINMNRQHSYPYTIQQQLPQYQSVKSHLIQPINQVAQGVNSAQLSQQNSQGWVKSLRQQIKQEQQQNFIQRGLGSQFSYESGY